MPDDLTDYDADDLIHMIEAEVREENAPPNLRSAANADAARDRLRLAVAMLREVEIPLTTPCAICGATGFVDKDGVKTPCCTCEMRRALSLLYWLEHGEHAVRCPECHGRGTIKEPDTYMGAVDYELCPRCNGLCFISADELDYNEED